MAREEKRREEERREESFLAALASRVDLNGSSQGREQGRGWQLARRGLVQAGKAFVGVGLVPPDLGTPT